MSATGDASVYIYNGTGNVPRDITKVEVADTVKRLGNWVFEGCESLIEIKIPSSVTSIGDRVFAGCVALETITIPDFVTRIGDEVFRGCDSLKSIAIMPSTKVGNNVFYGCVALESVTGLDAAIDVSAYDNVFDGRMATKNVSELDEAVPDIISEVKDGDSVKRLDTPGDASVYINDGTGYVPNNVTKVEAVDTVTKRQDNAFCCNFWPVPSQ